MSVSELSTRQGINSPIKKYEGLSTDTKPTNCGAYSEYRETDTGKGFVFDGSAWHVAAVGGGFHNIPFDALPGTVYEHSFVDVANYTGHGSATGVQAAELVGVSLPSGVRVLRVTAVSGPDAGVGADFAGAYFALNQATSGDAQTALSHTEGTTTAVEASGLRRFVQAGESVVVRADADITNIYVTALDNNTTPKNTIVVEGKAI